MIIITTGIIIIGSTDYTSIKNNICQSNIHGRNNKNSITNTIVTMNINGNDNVTNIIFLSLTT